MLAEDLRNAAIILSSPLASNPGSASAISEYIRTLSHYLSRRCSQPGSFQRSLAHRILRMSQVHEALGRSTDKKASRSQNQRAVTALVALSSVRGQASDILLLVTVLLGVGVNLHSPPPLEQTSSPPRPFGPPGGDPGEGQDPVPGSTRQHSGPAHAEREDNGGDGGDGGTPHTTGRTMRDDEKGGRREGERGEEYQWRETPTSKPKLGGDDSDGGPGGVMDKGTRKKMEAKKRMRMNK
ncbi:hypothetical protein TrRE_jg1446, partial [Triparma retinervis]